MELSNVKLENDIGIHIKTRTAFLAKIKIYYNKIRMYKIS